MAAALLRQSLEQVLVRDVALHAGGHQVSNHAKCVAALREDMAAAVSEWEMEQKVVVITCNHLSDDGAANSNGIVKCTNLAGAEVATVKVPSEQEPYGSWLGEEVAKMVQKDVWRLRLVSTTGEIIWREEGISQRQLSDEPEIGPMFEGLIPAELVAALVKSSGSDDGVSWNNYDIEEAYELPDDEEMNQLRKVGC